MSDPFVGQMLNVGFNFAPRGWATCDGQLLAISSNTALFSLLGTQYGGNGSTTFALPDLRGRVAIHQGQRTGGSNYSIGELAGTETTTLTVTNLPAHNHPAAFTNGNSTLTANNVKGTNAAPQAGYQLARGIDGDGDPNAIPFLYAPATPSTPVLLSGVNVAGTVAVGITGSNAPFSILSPYLVINTIISLQGIYPSRN